MARFQKALAQLMRQENGDQEPRRENPAAAGSVVSELRTRVSSEELALVSAFAKLFLANARLLEAAYSSADVAGLTLGACRFLCDRHTSPVALRTYVPVTSEHGWSSDHLVLELVTDDQVGLVNAVCGIVEGRGGQIEALVSATAHVTRNPTGLVTAIAPPVGQSDEHILHLQLTGVDNPASLENDIRQRLTALGRSRHDAGVLHDELRQLSSRLSSGSDEDRENGQLIEWLADGRFNVSGFQEIAPDGSVGRSVGVLEEPLAGLDPTWDGTPPRRGVCLFRTRAADPVRAGEFLDELRLCPQQAPASEPLAYRIVGTLAARTARERASGIPVVRVLFAEMLDEIRQSSPNLNKDAAAAIFDGLPIDFVLASRPDAVAEIVRAIAAGGSNPAFRVLVSPGPEANPLTCFLTILVPRQHLARSDADSVVRIVHERVATVLAKHFVSDDLPIVRLHYTVDIAAVKVRPELIEDLASNLRKVLSSWREAPLVARSATQEPAAPAPGVGASAQAPGEPATTVADRIEVEPDQAGGRRFSLRITTGRGAGEINQLVRAIDDLGLRILRHRSESESQAAETHEISLEVAGEGTIDAARTVELLQAVRNRQIESDILNSLSWRAGLSAATIDVLRALAALAEVSGIAHRSVTREVLSRHPELTRTLVRAFEIKFDPKLPLTSDAQRKRDLETARAVLDSGAERLADHADRNLLRSLGRMLDRIVRTSFYCGDKNLPGRTIALKIVNASDSELPYETFVYAPTFEGHMVRAGLAARARVRRIDDIGSIRANGIRELADEAIRASRVSTDAGVATFALKSNRPSADQIDRAARSFVESLLDVTDDVVNGELARNEKVVAHDDADSYFCLIVGERPSGFAELARQVVQKRGFWMGDAAVTRFDGRVAAEGAWSGLQPLLDRTGAKDEPLTAVVIGSPHELRFPPGARLVAGFDGAEIFLDPSSDPKKCGEALAKLGRQETSSWGEIPIDLRERGSSVVSRDANKVELSEEARELLALPAGPTTADEIVRAILAYEADLLWVCTATARAVTADELGHGTSGCLEVESSGIGARFVIEIGASLFSPAARISFAQAGGVAHSLPTDGIAADLVADRISNIDLALDLAGPRRQGLEANSAEVAAGIRRTALDAPPRESVAVDLDLYRAEREWPAVSTCLRGLSESGRTMVLERYSLSEPEVIRRYSLSTSLSRPEVAVLRAAVGLHLQHEIRGSSLCEDPYIRPWLDDYFPAPIAEQAPELIEQHPLRYEIAAVAISDRILELMGFAFVADTAATHGRAQIDVVKAWCAALIFGGVQEVWGEIERSELAAGSPEHQRHRLEIAQALRRATRRIIELRSADLSLEKIMDRLAAGVGELLRGWPETLPDEIKEHHEQAIDLNVRTGLTRVTADHLARIEHLGEIVDICDLAIQINSPRSTVATAFLGLDTLLHFGEIDTMIAAVRQQDPIWGDRAAAQMRARLSTARRGLTTEVVSHAAGRRQPVERYVDSHGDDIHAARRLVGEVRRQGHPSAAAIEVLLGALENLTRGQRRAW